MDVYVIFSTLCLGLYFLYKSHTISKSSPHKIDAFFFRVGLSEPTSHTSIHKFINHQLVQHLYILMRSG